MFRAEDTAFFLHQECLLLFPELAARSPRLENLHESCENFEIQAEAAAAHISFQRRRLSMPPLA
jgi:hypothetical protein